jgi:hypothetical protein
MKLELADLLERREPMDVKVLVQVSGHVPVLIEREYSMVALAELCEGVTDAFRRADAAEPPEEKPEA